MRTTQKIISIFSKSEHRRAIIILLLMIVGMVLETLSIGAIIPALTLLVQSDLTQFPIINDMFPNIDNLPKEELLIYTMIFLVILYTIKTVFMIFSAWVQSHFLYDLQKAISRKLFKGYMYMPYDFHLQTNSATILRNTITEVAVFISVTQGALVFISEMFILIGIFLLLIFVEPYGALSIIFLFVLASIIFYRLIRNHIMSWGNARHVHDELRIKHLQQGIGAAKEIKLLGKEEHFINKFLSDTNKMMDAAQKQFLWQQIPRLWLELLAISSLCVLVIVMVSQNQNTNQLLPILGMFAAAAFRFMPSINKILIAFQSMRYGVAVVDTLHEEIQRFNPIDRESISNKHVKNLQKNIMFDNVSFKYPVGDTKVLKNINFKITKGSMIGIVGESGAGKSTLINLMLGLISPTNGKVLVDNIDIKKDLRAWQKQIGYVPQNIYLTDDSLTRNIAFGIPQEEIDMNHVRACITSVNLDNLIEQLPQGLDTLVGERGARISGGQLQRLGLARALYNDPEVLVLDEATSSLDIETEEKIMKTIKNFHGLKTIIIISHRMSTLKYCDLLFNISNGKLNEVQKNN